ncbi:hypothetical protein [Moritella dasanensis]|uniref:hypothetical protein n=1 Tax=Moritella dasanensis TaxID=428031 RepID=UPI001ED9336E|nr:hypothetical protein [Moritella dasanensis]
MAKSCGFSSFQLLQQATEIFVQNSEIEDLMVCIDKSKKTNISSLEISNLLSCDITCLENNGGVGVLLYSDNTVCETPILTESKPYFANATLYELPADRGIHILSSDWHSFILRVQQQIDNCDAERQIDIGKLIDVEWSATEFMDFDDISLTNPDIAYAQDLESLTEGQFRKLVCEQSIYSSADAVYELLNLNR